jgi:hypothetical protein
MGDIPSWFGAPLSDCDGTPVGAVCDVYFDQASSRPAWMLVDVTGPDERYALVPTAGADSRRGRVTVAFEREVIRASPAIVPAATLHSEMLLRLSRHYGVRVDRGAAYAAVHGIARTARAA